MANIPTISSESIQVGLAPAPPIAAVDIWPSLNPTALFSQQVNGSNNFLALTNQIGVFNGIGLQSITGLSNIMGFKTAVGGEVNAEPGVETSAPYITLNSPLGNLLGGWRYNGSTICAPCPSDERTKLNVKKLDDSLKKVLRLQGVSFEWNSEIVPNKSQKQKSSIGLIAQEVESIIPEVVVTETIENQELKTVEYGNLTALLIEAIKEQQEQINTLKKTVRKLSTKLDKTCSTCYDG